VREFLSDSEIPFDDRNIRQSGAARDELAARTTELVVPQLFWRDRHIVGFDPAALEELVQAYRDSDR
jgi:glutaredoxin